MKLLIITSALIATSAMASGSKAPADKVGQYTCSAIGTKTDPRGARHSTVTWGNYFVTKAEAEQDAKNSCALQYGPYGCETSACYQVDSSGELQHVN